MGAFAVYQKAVLQIHEKLLERHSEAATKLHAGLAQQALWALTKMAEREWGARAQAVLAVISDVRDQEDVHRS